MENEPSSKYNLLNMESTEVIMSTTEALEKITLLLENTVQIEDDLELTILDPLGLRKRIEEVVRIAALGEEPYRSTARWLIRECAIELGIIPASIHDFYLARGRGEIRDDFTVPAINLRFIPFYAAKAVFCASSEIDAKALIFEIARSEIGYTSQRPSEYASCILGAAIAEGYQGPVFLQGDHYQISAKKYQQNAEQEFEAVQNLALESIRAGFFNIDIDTSTLVDLSKSTIPEQQEINYRLSSELASYIRSHEPEGVTV